MSQHNGTDSGRTQPYPQPGGRTASALAPYAPRSGTAARHAGHGDITGRGDIIMLVEAFYRRAFRDELIGPVFTEVVQLDLPRHLPIMADFWQTVLFKVGLYRRNALAVHLAIAAKSPLDAASFNRWLQLWTATVDELFAGEKAELAKVQAHQIAGSLHRRVNGRPAGALHTIGMRQPEAGRRPGS